MADSLTTPLRIGVGKLVDFACRSGDLAPGPTPGPSASEGIRAHRALQQQLAGEYQSEVEVKTTLLRGGQEVELCGRVDLLNSEHESAVIAEIKTCHGDPARLPPAQTQRHWSQLKVYGFCYLRMFPARHIQLRMIWFDALSQQSHQQSIEFTLRELEAFCTAALDTYLRWLGVITELERASRQAASALDFPFGEFRGGQRSMAAAVFRCLRDGNELLCEAPTGIGKTVSALFPAVKALGHDHVDKIVYLTAKNSGRQVAWNTLSLMCNRGLQLPSLVLQAKTAACPCQNGGCELGAEEQCPMTIGFYDRLPAARLQLIESGLMSSDVISRVAEQHRLCPFELALQMLPWASLVICDYNYVFDPLVRLGWFADNDARVALVVDEAHNLVDRARQMHCAKLSRRDALLAVAGCKTSRPALSRKLASVSRALDRSKTLMQGDERVSNSPPAAIGRAIDRLFDALARDQINGSRPPPDLAEWLRALFRYRHIADIFGPHHRCITHREQTQLTVKLACLNAASYLQQTYKHFHAVVAFSATLRPTNFYRETLGMAAQCQSLTLPSPFASEHLGSFIFEAIDTRYQHRAESIGPIADLVQQVYQSQPGNYLVFFPSHHYLQLVAGEFARRYRDTPLVCQQAQSDNAAREQFLQQFRPGARTLGFAIMGGVYGEGVDYLGDSLIGAIVIGVGLPGLSTEQELIRQDFNAEGLDGFDFAYRFVGLSRVLQAAGRVIRQESDRGIVVLVDRRFAQQQYYSLLPDHWQPRRCNNNQQLHDGLARFWSDDRGTSSGNGCERFYPDQAFVQP
jgi:Rad3-related DNA helicase